MTKQREVIKEPCKDLIFILSRHLPLGSGRRDAVTEQPEVSQQIKYGFGYRLAKGFHILKGGSV